MSTAYNYVQCTYVWLEILEIFENSCQIFFINAHHYSAKICDNCLDLMCSDNDGVREERLLLVVD